MEEMARLLALYGLLLVFVSVFLDEGGLPIPSFVILLVAGAGSFARPPFLLFILATAVAAAVAADLVWYWVGRRFGRRIQTLLCRISLSPDTCVRQTEDLYNRVGPASLLIVRYLPGLTNITVTMAAISSTPFSLFLMFDLAGTTFFFGLPVLLGVVFHSAVDQVVNTLFAFGRFGLILVFSALLLYVGRRWWERASFIRQLRTDRISVDELIEMIEAGNTPVILDVRTEQARQQGGIIPGALPAHPNDTHPALLALARNAEIVVYCACPNEASAAAAARHLREAGFKRIRPLLGGVDAWLSAGQNLELAA